MKNKLAPFYLLSFALFIGLIVPVLIQDGMFMDATLYTCVSKNLGNGIGTFWFPVSEATWFCAGKSSFHEHPPLVFGIQSVFFRILGNSMYVERFYTFLMACLTAYLIFLSWKEIFRGNNEMLHFSWLPILLWIITPVAHWTFQNNMQENTMGLFSFLAVYLIFKSLNKETKSIRYIILAGFLIFFASLSKGVPGLFPIVTVGAYWLIFRKPSFNKVILFTGILVLIPVLIYSIIMINPNASESLTFYLNQRLLGRIENAHTVTGRLHTLKGLVSHLLPVLILCCILFFVFWKKKISFKFTYKKEFAFFLLLGLSASLPLMLTMVQKDFYFSHSIPYFGISFAFLLVNGLHVLIKKIDPSKVGFKIFKISSITLLAISVGLSIYNIGGQSRNKDELHDVHLLGKIIPEGTIIGIEPSMIEDYSTRFYLVRYYGISSEIKNESHQYFVVRKEGDTTGLSDYQRIDLETLKFDSYVKTNGSK